ncbi:MAG: hypothetical protein H7Y37_07340 [Anaerolineae bacterium]|nr:hypothetical protein [Gloeobacterales cyanobacterium ES-bin-313]
MGNIEKTLSLLSLGPRGVGKTVFLAASFRELEEISSQAKALKGWLGFNFDDERSRGNISSLIASIERTGAYPPPTPAVSDFALRLHLGSPPLELGTLCRFRWQDVPGELCAEWNPQFRSMVMAAHGCCLFVEAPALADTQKLEAYSNIVDQAMAIAMLAANNRLVMPFVVVLTKCDLLEGNAGEESRLHEQLNDLIGSIVSLVPDCRIVCCQAPIAFLGDQYRLRPSGCSEALLWLMQQTWQAHVGTWPRQWMGVLRALGQRSNQEAGSLAPGLIERLLGGQKLPHSPEGVVRSGLDRNEP